MIDYEEIKEAIYNHYGIEDEEEDAYTLECGCYVGGEWLSVSEILDIIKKVCE